MTSTNTSSNLNPEPDEKKAWWAPQLVMLQLDETFSGAIFDPDAEGVYFTNIVGP